MDYAKIVRDATAEKQELLARVEKLDALIASASALSGSSVPPERTRTSKRVSSVGTPTRKIVLELLRERGRPIETRELVGLVRGRGVEVGGKDPIATLSARLSNAPEFQIHRGIGWWFTGEPVPGERSIFEEAAETPSKEDSAASNASQGGSEDAAALGHDS